MTAVLFGVFSAVLFATALAQLVEFLISSDVASAGFLFRVPLALSCAGISLGILKQEQQAIYVSVLSMAMITAVFVFLTG